MGPDQIMTASTFKTVAERQAEDAASLGAFSGFSMTRFRHDVAEALSTFGRMGIFEQYTKHDISHVDGILASYEWLIPESTQHALSPADWLLITLASYLHDFGLIVTRHEYENRDHTLFLDFVESVEKAESASGKDYAAEINRIQTRGDQIKFLYQEFVRTNHGARIASWLAGRPDPRLGFDPAVVDILANLTSNLNEDFVEDLGLICQSHNLDDISNLNKYSVDKPYGRTPGEAANLQYCAIVLRSADLLHITSDRAPAIAAKIINPSSPVSQAEWAKQRAVKTVRKRLGYDADGRPDRNAPSDTVEVHARFNEAEGYFGLSRYLQYAEGELANCYTWALESQRKYASTFEFPWRRIDVSKVEAKGFEPKPFEFELDQHRILDLLTGHMIYNDTSVVVRELTQNSIDAVRLYGYQDSVNNYSPEVIVQWIEDSGTLVVTDNGTGMTQTVLEKNFLRVGASRYQDTSFRKQFPNFSAISRFGIGVLSAFMIADNVEVLTLSEEDDQARLLTLRSVHGKYLIKLIDKTSEVIPELIRGHGTEIRLHVRPSAAVGDILKHLQQYIVVPQCKVEFEDQKNAATYQIGFDSARDALTSILAAGLGTSIEGGRIFTGPFRDEIKVCRVEVGGLELAYAMQWNKWLERWSLARSVPARRNGEQLILGTCIEGIRVTNTSPGFTIGSGVIAIANMKGPQAPRTNVARGALERTREYDDLLGNVYQTYAEQITREVHEMQTERGKSLTNAVREASYLLTAIQENLEAPDLMRSKLRTVPAFVTEQAADRAAMSLADLSDIGAVTSFDGPLIRYAENLLASAPTSATLYDILVVLGADSIIDKNDRMICGELRTGRFNDFFLDEWTPSTIRGSAETRTLRCTWERLNPQSPRWVNLFDSAEQTFPEELLYLVDNESRKFNLTNTKYWFPIGQVQVDGLDEYDAVSVADRLLVLPGGRLNGVRPASLEVPPRVVAYISSWLTCASARHVPPPDHDRHIEGVREFLQLVTEAQFDKFIDLSTVEDFIKGLHGARTFNAVQWDRLFGDHESE